MNFDIEPEHEQQLRQERNALEDKTFALRQTITGLRRQLASQRAYIAELERQLEYANPGIVEEVREFLKRYEN